MNQFESIAFVPGWTREKRDKLGLSQAEVAARATELLKEAGGKRTLSYQSIQQLERGEHKGVPDWFRFVREAIEEKLEEQREVDRAKARSSASSRPPIEPEIPPTRPDDIEMIREVDIRYAMGAGSALEEFPEVGQMPFNRGFRRMLTSAPAEALFVAKGDGDSMQPTLINEDSVLIDTSQNRVTQSDRIWALRIEDAGLIKRVRILPKVGYELISDNPLIPPQTVSRDDVTVVGRVIWVGRRV